MIKTFRKWWYNKADEENDTDCLEILGDRENRHKFSQFWKDNSEELKYVAEILRLLKKERGDDHTLSASELVTFFEECSCEIDNEIRNKNKKSRRIPTY